ncbi:MFS transporter [Dactylococcopsis salina]|uniref:Arabinose efflux permease family protein n=1 Tax=Dactylococcopsis salina (strain PCC 8305) TaxID=13035 RepID=K9YSC7_DACS8|nr:MFS transporter [Dactylococcopsis salina]AFZ49235.1 arabinose efflux permease family protein [Dactylococcopsis salina PCC 8305]
MNVLKTLTPAQKKNLAVLAISGLLFWTSLTTLLPTLPAYISDVGGSKHQVGLVMGSFAIGLLLFRAQLGQLSDQRSRKLVVMIGTFVVGTAPLGYLSVDSIPLLMAFRAFHGISIAAFTTGYSTLVVDWSPPEKRGELIGYMSLVVPVGLALGPALGGYLQVSVGYEVLFMTSATLGYLGLLFASQVTEAGKKQVEEKEREDTSQQAAFWTMLLSPRIRTPAMVLFMVGLVFGTLTTFLPLYVRELGIDLNPGLYYTTSAIASFAMRIFIGKASDQFGRGIFITMSLTLYVVAMFLLATANTPIEFLVAAIAQGAGGGTLIPMMIALMSDRSTTSERGRIYALSIGGFDLGIALAGPGIGSFAEILGYRGLFQLGVSLALVALLIFITRSSKSIAHSFRFATGREKDVYAVK